MKVNAPAVGKNFQALTVLTAFYTFALIVIGGIVRVSGSGLGCPDWPLCHGQIIPPFEFHTLVEYSHRLTTTLVTFCILATALVATIKYRAHWWIFRGALLAVALLFLQIVLGGITVLLELPPTVVAIHLGNAMLLLATVLTVAALAWRGTRATDVISARANSPLSFNLVLVSAASIYILILSGAVVAGSGASSACKSLPLCNNDLIPTGLLPIIHMLHRIIAAAAGMLALYTFFRAAQVRMERAISTIGFAGAVLLSAQIFVGAVNVWLQFPPLLAGLHLALAAAVWGALVMLAVILRSRRAATASDEQPRASGKPIRASLADYFALTKPWIVALLLTTTFGAMLIAAQGLPRLDSLFLGLLGGACAAGGANALNSYIDRDTDKQMARTSRRPLPSGRVQPRRALIFALALCASSVIILGLGVNWLSSILALVGIIYYAVIYTILLKRATPQNIVVGGAAGAIPPLVGWAAVTNDVSLLALYLFAIILLWTPPHTWALMLLLDKDYNRVRIPMLPAAWGELEARRQIILYSVLLVAITLVPFSFGALGVIYFSGALVLGIYFLLLATRLWRASAAYKPAARKLYRFSNAYLALLFLAMVVDHWLIPLHG